MEIWKLLLKISKSILEICLLIFTDEGKFSKRLLKDSKLGKIGKNAADSFQKLLGESN